MLPNRATDLGSSSHLPRGLNALSVLMPGVAPIGDSLSIVSAPCSPDTETDQTDGRSGSLDAAEGG